MDPTRDARPVLVVPPYQHQKGQNVVYWITDGYGEILYIGVTKHFWSRMRAHARSKPWWAEVERISWYPYATRAEAEEVEAQGIERANPKYNIARTAPYVDVVAIALADPRAADLREAID